MLPYEEQNLGIPWLMPSGVEFMVTITAVFDESGKFKDHDVVSFGGIACPAVEVKAFSEEWHRCLHATGLQSLTMKEALRHNRPLSDKNPALGIAARTEALLPFIAAIRTRLQAIVGIALDVKAFTNLPSHYHQMLGSDPFFTAFLRTVSEVLELTSPDDKITLICDDEEQMAEPMYKLYRRVKLVDPDARNKLKGICFADDEYLFLLQAADFISSLIRREGGRKFFQEASDYEALFTAMVKQPDRATEKVWACNIAFADRPMLERCAESMKKVKRSNEPAQQSE